MCMERFDAPQPVDNNLKGVTGLYNDAVEERCILTPPPSPVPVNWTELGYNSDCQVRDLWRQSDLGVTSKVKSFVISSHGCVMLKMIQQINKDIKIAFKFLKRVKKVKK